MTVLSTAYRYLFLHLPIVFCYHCCRAMFLLWPFRAFCCIANRSYLWHRSFSSLQRNILDLTPVLWNSSLTPLAKRYNILFPSRLGGDLCNHLSCKCPEIEEHFKTINWRGIKLLWYHTKFIPRQSVDIMKVNKYAQSQNLWSMAIWSKSQEIIMCIILLTSHDKSLA